MKKIFFIIIMALGMITSSAYASGFGLTGVQARYYYVLLSSSYSFPYLTCIYATYETQTGKFVQYKQNQIFQSSLQTHVCYPSF